MNQKITKKHKMLFVSSCLPFHTKGGDLVVLKNITKALSESGIDFDLLCFDRGESPLLRTQATSVFSFQNIYPITIDPKINTKKLFEWGFGEKSYLFNRFYSKNLSEKLLKLIQTGNYSSIIFEHTYMYTNVLFNPDLIKEIRKRSIKTIINTHVLESSVYKQAHDMPVLLPLPFSIPAVILNFLMERELRLLKDIEFECIKSADKAVFLGQQDFNTAQNTLPEEKENLKLLEIKPFKEDYPYSEPEYEEKNSVYFLGTYSWVQNRDAAMYFAKEILPLILKENPEVKFYLLGRNAEEDIKNLHDGKNIFFVGEKEDIFEETKKYSLLVNPLRIKGGTSLKIIEAICHGKAIIVTSVGIAGINTYGENPVLIADTAEEFAEKVLEVLSDNDSRIKIKQNARNFAQKHFSFEEFKRDFLDILNL